MGKFKVGDRVLCTETCEGQFTAGKTYTVRAPNTHSLGVVEDDSGCENGWSYDFFNPVPVAESTGTATDGAQADKPKFKVGDRVRVTDPVLLRYGTPIGAMGTITMAGDNYVEFDLDHPEDGKIGQVLSYPHDYLEPVAVAQQPQPLRIEAGKFYRTRDGRKVGPMRRWSDEAKHRWEAADDEMPYIWADDGTEIDSDIDDGADLVVEADEPPAEPQSTKEILDELEAWIAEQDAAKEAGNGSTAGFTVPLCALEAEPDLTAIGKAYADGYAAGLRAAA